MQKSAVETKRFTLSDASIDEASEQIQAFLAQCGTPRKEITRCRLSAEEAMVAWQGRLGADTVCRLTCRRRLGKLSVNLAAEGERADPYERGEDDPDFGEGRGLLARLGLTGSYKYHNGINELLLSPPGKTRNPILSVAMAVGFALAVGLALSFLPENTRSAISGDVIGPFFNMLLNVLSTIATPMIFLAVCSGIYSIGDMALLGRVGKKLVMRFVGMVFAVLVCTLICTVWFFPVKLAAGGAGNGEAALAIYELLLSIVPENMIAPFIQGNALQVIFLGCACGIGALVLGEKISSLAEIAEQFHSLVRVLMSAIGRIVPLFVFTCVLDLLLSGGFVKLSGASKQITLCIGIMLLLMLVKALAVCKKTGVPVPLLVRKLLPTFLVAVTTASSAAAFAVNTETCKHKLGVSEKLVDFGIPLGQVLYKPMSAVTFFISALCIGELYGVTITPVWLLINVLVSGILAIATPPIPGGALSCYTILFLQLGIPAPGVALAISVDLIMDFLLTASDIYSLQTSLVLLASDMDMLDEDTIRKK